MATTTSSTDAFSAPVIDPMGDLDQLEIQHPQDALSEHGEMLAAGIHQQPSVATPKKRAYFVVTAKEGDPALRTPDRDSDREINMDILRRQGYEVTLFKTSRAFFDHIAADKSPVDLLVIADHGNTRRVGDLRVQEGTIVSTDPNLTDEERATGFQNLSTLMNKDSILLFHACLAGNKTVENNIARVASRIIPQADIYACQYVTLYEPGFQYKLDDKKGVVIDTINYGYAGDEVDDALGLVAPAIYRNGEELTGQEPVPLPLPPSTSARSYKSYMVGAVAFAVLATIVGIGMNYFRQQGAAS